MDPLTSQMRALGDRIPGQSDHLDSLEATRTALVLPVFQALGYDVFDTAEFLPAPGPGNTDVPAAEGPDYAVMKDGAPLFLVECRRVGESLLPVPATRTGACFPLGTARAAVFTDGIRFQVHTDLDQPGRLDSRPVMVFDLAAFDEQEAFLLPWLVKGNFDAEAFRKDAADVSRLFPRLLAQAEQELNAPSDGLVRLLSERVYHGPLTAEIEEELGGLVQRAFKKLIRDRIRERLVLAISLDGPPEERVEEVERLFSPTMNIHTRPLDGVPIPERLEDPGIEEEPAPAAGSAAGGGRAMTWVLVLLLLGVSTWGAWRWSRNPPPAAPATLPAAPPVPGPPAPTPQTASASPAEPTVPKIKPAHVLMVATGDLAGAAELGRQRALALGPDRWVLRLAIAYENRTVVGLLESLPGHEDAVFLLPIRMKDGRSCYQVFLGDFDSEAVALAQRTTLPAWFLNQGNVPIAYRVGAIPEQQ